MQNSECRSGLFPTSESDSFYSGFLRRTVLNLSAVFLQKVDCPPTTWQDRFPNKRLRSEYPQLPSPEPADQAVVPSGSQHAELPSCHLPTTDIEKGSRPGKSRFHRYGQKRAASPGSPPVPTVLPGSPGSNTLPPLRHPPLFPPGTPIFRGGTWRRFAGHTVRPGLTR